MTQEARRTKEIALRMLSSFVIFRHGFGPYATPIKRECIRVLDRALVGAATTTAASTEEVIENTEAGCDLLQILFRAASFRDYAAVFGREEGGLDSSYRVFDSVATFCDHSLSLCERMEADEINSDVCMRIQKEILRAMFALSRNMHTSTLSVFHPGSLDLFGITYHLLRQSAQFPQGWSSAQILDLPSARDFVQAVRAEVTGDITISGWQVPVVATHCAAKVLERFLLNIVRCSNVVHDINTDRYATLEQELLAKDSEFHEVEEHGVEPEMSFKTPSFLEAYGIDVDTLSLLCNAFAISGCSSRVAAILCGVVREVVLHDVSDNDDVQRADHHFALLLHITSAMLRHPSSSVPTPLFHAAEQCFSASSDVFSMLARLLEQDSRISVLMRGTCMAVCDLCAAIFWRVEADDAGSVVVALSGNSSQPAEHLVRMAGSVLLMLLRHGPPLAQAAASKVFSIAAMLHYSPAMCRSSRLFELGGFVPASVLLIGNQVVGFSCQEDIHELEKSITHIDFTEDIIAISDTLKYDDTEDKQASLHIRPSMIPMYMARFAASVKLTPAALPHIKNLHRALTQLALLHAIQQTMHREGAFVEFLQSYSTRAYFQPEFEQQSAQDRAKATAELLHDCTTIAHSICSVEFQFCDHAFAEWLLKDADLVETTLQLLTNASNNEVCSHEFAQLLYALFGFLQALAVCQNKGRLPWTASGSPSDSESVESENVIESDANRVRFRNSGVDFDYMHLLLLIDAAARACAARVLYYEVRQCLQEAQETDEEDDEEVLNENPDSLFARNENFTQQQRRERRRRFALARREVSLLLSCCASVASVFDGSFGEHIPLGAAIYCSRKTSSEESIGSGVEQLTRMLLLMPMQHMATMLPDQQCFNVLSAFWLVIFGVFSECFKSLLNVTAEDDAGGDPLILKYVVPDLRTLALQVSVDAPASANQRVRQSARAAMLALMAASRNCAEQHVAHPDTFLTPCERVTEEAARVALLAALDIVQNTPSAEWPGDRHDRSSCSDDDEDEDEDDNDRNNAASEEVDDSQFAFVWRNTRLQLAGAILVFASVTTPSRVRELVQESARGIGPNMIAFFERLFADIPRLLSRRNDHAAHVQAKLRQLNRRYITHFTSCCRNDMELVSTEDVAIDEDTSNTAGDTESESDNDDSSAMV
ncbi:MAG: hypothetical protein MHM6MM_001124 [Cercozoa sp. M6MM]